MDSDFAPSHSWWHSQSHVLLKFLGQMLLGQGEHSGRVVNMTLSVKVSMVYEGSVSRTDLLINVVTSLSSMVFRPACLE